MITTLVTQAERIAHKLEFHSSGTQILTSN